MQQQVAAALAIRKINPDRSSRTAPARAQAITYRQTGILQRVNRITGIDEGRRPPAVVQPMGVFDAGGGEITPPTVALPSLIPRL